MKLLKSLQLQFWPLLSLWALQSTRVQSFSFITTSCMSNPLIRHSKLYHHHEKDEQVEQDEQWHPHLVNRRRMLCKSMIITSTVAASMTKASNANAIISPQIIPNNYKESKLLKSIEGCTNPSSSSSSTSTNQQPSSTIMLSNQKKSIQSLDPRYFIAGGTCASISHGLATPFDVIKTRIQAQPDEFQNTNIIQSIQIILKQTSDDTSAKNASILLIGLAPTMIGYFVEGAFKFGIYEALKPIILSIFAVTYGTSSSNLSTFVPYLIASAIAGAVASILLCPMEDARIKMVTDPTYDDKSLVS